MAPALTSVGHAFKRAMHEAITGLVDTEEVLVTWGHPGATAAGWLDAISVADLDVGQDTATMGTNRSREETLTLTVWVSVHRPGTDPDLEQACSQRAFELLGLIEQHVRQTDTTLGGAVRQCFLSRYSEAGFVDAVLLAKGRTVEIEATFTAQARVTGP